MCLNDFRLRAHRTRAPPGGCGNTKNRAQRPLSTKTNRSSDPNPMSTVNHYPEGMLTVVINSVINN